MKSLKLIITSLLFLALSTFSFATSELKFDIDKSNAKAMLVELQYSKPTDVFVRVTDRDGNELVDQVYKNVISSTKKFNMVGLIDGTYKFVIEDNLKKVFKNIEIRNSKLVITEDEKTYFKPTVRLQEDILFFSMLSFSNENIDLVLSNSEGDVLYYETMKADGVMERALNISALPKGNYTVTASNYEVENVFEIKK